MAVKVGHLFHVAKWDSDNTEIAISLSGENYDVDLVIEYESKNLSGFEDENRKQAIKDKL
jgi:hypothetical protein